MSLGDQKRANTGLTSIRPMKVCSNVLEGLRSDWLTRRDGGGNTPLCATAIRHFSHNTHYHTTGRGLENNSESVAHTRVETLVGGEGGDTRVPSVENPGCSERLENGTLLGTEGDDGYRRRAFAQDSPYERIASSNIGDVLETLHEGSTYGCSPDPNARDFLPPPREWIRVNRVLRPKQSRAWELDVVEYGHREIQRSCCATWSKPDGRYPPAHLLPVADRY